MSLLIEKEGAGEDAIDDTVARWFSDTHKSWEICALVLILASDSCKKSSHVICLAMTQYFLYKLEATPLICICCLKIFPSKKINATLYWNKTRFCFQKLDFFPQ